MVLAMDAVRLLRESVDQKMNEPLTITPAVLGYVIAACIVGGAIGECLAKLLIAWIQRKRRK